jgi:peptide alpha-N-acetyltransferase
MILEVIFAGMFYRSDNNYKEASKCYLQALKKDPNNQNILRDLSWLQIQVKLFISLYISINKLLLIYIR